MVTLVTLHFLVLSHVSLMSPSAYLIFLGLIVFLYVSLSLLPHLFHLLAPSTINPFAAHSSLLVVDLSRGGKAATSPVLFKSTELPRASMESLKKPFHIWTLCPADEPGNKRTLTHTHPIPLHDTPRLGMEELCSPHGLPGVFLCTPEDSVPLCLFSGKPLIPPGEGGTHTPLGSTAHYMCSSKSYNLAL